MGCAPSVFASRFRGEGGRGRVVTDRCSVDHRRRLQLGFDLPVLVVVVERDDEYCNPLECHTSITEFRDAILFKDEQVDGWDGMDGMEWMDGWIYQLCFSVVCLSMHLSLSLSRSLSRFLSRFLSLSFCLSAALSLPLSVCARLPFSASLALSLYLPARYSESS